ncbi:MAG: hypothetical protein ABNH21_17365 [Glaciecola sp.]|jgi:integrase
MLKLFSQQHKCIVFAQDDLAPILLPTFFSNSLSRTQQIFVVTRNQHLDEKPIENITMKFILNRLEQFLFWIEEYAKGSKFVSLNNHHSIPNELINYYLNEVIIVQKGLGEASVKQSIQALTSYYNYLYQSGISDNLKDLFIKPKYREQARSNTKSRTAVKYLTPELRNILYYNTTTIRDELLLRTGGECGLRSRENQGFLLDDFKVGAKTYKGLLTLFDDMKNHPEKVEFEYFMQGRFSKSVRYSGGKSRMVFLHRSLLERFKAYYDNERPESMSDSFFLNNSNSNDNNPISAKCATQVFTKTRARVLFMQTQGLTPKEGQQLEIDHTHHVLRHSFGTDKFYTLSEENNMAVDDVTTTSQVFLTVAALMGHNASSKSAPSTTRRYIRSCHIKTAFDCK